MLARFRTAWTAAGCLSVVVALFAPATLSAEPGTHSIVLDSEILGEQRQILVSLPGSYQHTQANYPVLVATDAEFIHEFAVGASRYLSRRGKAPELIVVGIINTHRGKDLFYEADNFTAFLEKELIPHIDDRFRTSELRILFGFSSGTVPVDRLLFSNNALFSMFIATGWGMSDSGYERASKSLRETEFTGQRVFFSTEGTTVRRKNVALFLDDLERLQPDKLQWKGHIYESMDHGDVMPRGLYDGLEFLFKNWGMPRALAEKGVDGLAEHERLLHRQLSHPLAIQSETIANSTYELLQSGQADHAQAVLSLLDEAIRRKPWDPEMLAYRAFALWQYGESDDAKATIRQAIDLAKESSDPRLPEFRSMLDEWLQQNDD